MNLSLYEKSYGKEGYTYYMNNILKEKPSYILYSSSELNNNLDIFKIAEAIYLVTKKI